jgi:hypothetical protein
LATNAVTVAPTFSASDWASAKGSRSAKAVPAATVWTFPAVVGRDSSPAGAGLDSAPKNAASSLRAMSRGQPVADHLGGLGAGVGGQLVGDDRQPGELGRGDV